MAPMDSLAAYLAGSGLVGEAVRVIVSYKVPPPADGGVLATAKHLFVDPFGERKAIGDLFIGILVGILWTVWPPIEFPVATGLVGKCGIVAASAYFCGDVILNLFSKLSGFAAVSQSLGAANSGAPGPPPAQGQGVSQSGPPPPPAQGQGGIGTKS